MPPRHVAYGLTVGNSPPCCILLINSGGNQVKKRGTGMPTIVKYLPWPAPPLPASQHEPNSPVTEGRFTHRLGRTAQHFTKEPR